MKGEDIKKADITFEKMKADEEITAFVMSHIVGMLVGAIESSSLTRKQKLQVVFLVAKTVKEFESGEDEDEEKPEPAPLTEAEIDGRNVNEMLGSIIKLGKSEMDGTESEYTKFVGFVEAYEGNAPIVKTLKSEMEGLSDEDKLTIINRLVKVMNTSCK